MRGLFPGGIADGLGSVRTALALILTLVVLSAAGTVLAPVLDQAPAGVRRLAYLAGLSDTFRSPPFIVAGVLFAVNVGVCTWRRTIRGRGAGQGRGRATAWLDAGTHLALVVMVLGGGGKALFGDVGTGYLYPGTPATVMLNPLTGTERPLGFEVVLRERRTDHYPMSAKIGVRDDETGAKLGLLDVQEGVPASLAGTDLSVTLRGASEDGRAAILDAKGGGAAAELRFALKDGAAEPDRVGRYRLTLVAYRWLVRAVRGRVEIREAGRPVREAWLEVNGGVEHRGTRISIIAWSKDLSDDEFLGVQYRRDPAAPVFWAGTVALCVLLPAFIALRRRPAGR